MMGVRPASRSDIRSVAENMRNRDYEEISSLTFCDGRSTLAETVAFLIGNVGSARVFFLDDGQPVAIVHWTQTHPGNASVAMFATNSLYKVRKSLTRYCRDVIIPEILGVGVSRIECKSLDGYEEIHRWLEFLGFNQEARLKRYGRDGQDYLIFTLLAPEIVSGPEE